MAFVPVLLNENLSLNQIPLTFPHPPTPPLLRQTWRTQLILEIYPLRGYLPLIREDSFAHMHGLVVYVKDVLPFAKDLHLKSSADSYL